MDRRTVMILATLVLCGAAGYWLARDLAESGASPAKAVVAESSPPKPAPVENIRRFKSAGRTENPAPRREDEAARNAGALPNQRTLRFSDRAALEDFLRRAAGRIQVLGRINGLNAIRAGFSDYGELAALLDEETEEGFIFPVFDPAPPEGLVQPGAIGLADGLPRFLGITEDHSAWGRGVKVAVLDSGVAKHPALTGNILQLALVPLPENPAAMNGHGTAVASMIAGNSALTPGVAPAAEIFSVRISDDNGMSDSFLLAEGILAAVKEGAAVINISMGSQGDSRLVRDAIAGAVEAGAVIVAASGNNGLQQVSYPAANEGVIAVGAVDGAGEHLAFSNRGGELALSAPGYLINAAWTGNESVQVSGTSFSAPIISGAIAAIMSRTGGNMTPRQAYDFLAEHLNDTGAPGTDDGTGGGTPDLGRVFSRNTPGIFDAAVAASTLENPSPQFPNGSVKVLVQNRGTEPLLNTAVNVTMGAAQTTATITSLTPGESRQVTVPAARPPVADAEPLRVAATVSLPGGSADAKPENDSRARTYVSGGR